MFFARLLVVICSLFPGLALCDAYGSALVSEITSIYDADTFRANIDGWPSVVGARMPIRIKGVDAPEIRSRCEAEKLKAREAKQFTVAMLRNASAVRLDEIERGKYFRLLAVVYVDDVNLGEALIAQGLARPYDGSSRSSWCRE